MLAWQPEPAVSAEDRWSILNNSRTTTHNDPALARYHMLLSALDHPRWPHHRTAINKAAALH